MIGLRFNQVKNGDEVYYYPWLNKQNWTHSEPIKTTTRSEPFPIDFGQNGCSEGIFINGVAGYVLMSHLSKEYYPETNEQPKSNSELKYDNYISSDSCDSFADYLGIQKPKFEYYNGLVRMVSTKYTSVKGDYFKLKKDAKADYKLKLNQYKNSSR